MTYELKNGTGKMKEYLAGGMVELEKEFLNWKRNWVWKEYYKGQLAAETT
jgi:antitoxin component YwqK of YwqJK toxin-antitoxin module